MILFNTRPGNGCVVSISGPIYDYDATEFEACLSQADGGPLDVWVNSNGGDLPAGFTIRNLLSMYPGAIAIHAIGPVHSAASVAICVKNARVIAHKGAAFMIHQCRAYTDGTAGELRKTADVLDRLDDSLVAVYSERLKATDDEIRAMLADETWLDVDEAIRLGLVDEKFEEDPEVPMMPAPVPREEMEDDLIRRAVDACSARFAAEFKKATTPAAPSSPAFSDASKQAIADAVVPRVQAVVDSAEKKFADVSARVDALAKKCDELSAMNGKLSAALARAYALDGDEAVVARYVTKNAADAEFQLNKPY